MIRTIFASTLAIFIACAPLQAQLLPKTENEVAICPDQPSEPVIIAEMGVRESHKRILAQRMYRAAAFQAVVETQNCSCANRFPSWDIVVEYYLKNYSRIDDQWEIQEITKTYRASISSNRPKVREICQAQGNWN